MSALCKRMIKELELQRKSPHTIKAYVTAVKQLAAHFNRCPTTISREEVRDYIHHLITVKKLAVASVNVKVSGIVFLYRSVLGDSQFDLKIYSKPKRKLPEPFTRNEIAQIFSAASNLLKELRWYWQRYQPQQWLFEANGGRQYSPKTLQAAFAYAKAKAGVQRAGGIHGLRHSFATHLLENGMDMFTIKRLLGHASMKTTSGYLHVTRRHMQSINSPMDLLNQNATDQR